MRRNLKVPVAKGNPLVEPTEAEMDAYHDDYQLYLLQCFQQEPLRTKIERDIMRMSKAGKRGPQLLAQLNKLYSTQGDDMARARALNALDSYRRGPMTLHESMREFQTLWQEAEIAGCEIGPDHTFRYIANAAGEQELRDALRALTADVTGQDRNEALVKELERLGQQQKATDALLQSFTRGKPQGHTKHPEYSGAAQQQGRRGSKTHQHGLIDGSGRKASSSNADPRAPGVCKFCGETHVPGMPNCPPAINKEKCERCERVGHHRTRFCPVDASKLAHIFQVAQRRPGGHRQGRRQEAANGAVSYHNGDDCQSEQSDF
jgi:hypothetical protein